MNDGQSKASSHRRGRFWQEAQQCFLTLQVEPWVEPNCAVSNSTDQRWKKALKNIIKYLSIFKYDIVKGSLGI